MMSRGTRVSSASELGLAGVGERRLGEFFEEGVRIARPTPPVRVSP